MVRPGVRQRRHPGFTDDDNIVFSPHFYAESITMDRDLGIPHIVSQELQFQLAQRLADSYGAPLWSAESGYWGEPADVEAHMARYAAAEDGYMLGSAYWVWKQACGDPQNVVGPTGNGLMVRDCATGDTRNRKQPSWTIWAAPIPCGRPAGSLPWRHPTHR